MNKIFYFRHYITELQNPRIAALFKRHGVKAYGFYWHLLERLYAEEGNMLIYSNAFVKDLAKATKLRPRQVRSFIADMEALKLIGFRGERLYSERVENEIKEVVRSRQKRNSVS